MKIVKKTWGHEKWIVNNDLYCGKEIVIKSSKFSSKGKFHYHKIKDETFYVIRGTLLIDWYNETIALPNLGLASPEQVILKKGESFRIKPFVRHRFMGLSYFGCKFMEFSTHHEDSDSYYEQLFNIKGDSSVR